MIDLLIGMGSVNGGVAVLNYLAYLHTRDKRCLAWGTVNAIWSVLTFKYIKQLLLTK